MGLRKEVMHSIETMIRSAADKVAERFSSGVVHAVGRFLEKIVRICEKSIIFVAFANELIAACDFGGAPVLTAGRV